MGPARGGNMSILLLFFALFSFAQPVDKNFQYTMDGDFQATLPGFPVPQTVHFTLLWNETDSTISGQYRDNLFSTGTPVTGTSGTNGKVFNTSFPIATQKVVKLSITTVATKVDGGTIPLMVFMKDMVDMTVDQYTTSGAVTIRTDYVPENQSCVTGFGEVRGYCGKYKGKLTEIMDSGNFCNLPDYSFLMELSNEARVNLYFYYSDTTIGIPTHALGAFDAIPLGPSISMNERHCGSLTGTNFPTTDCQTLRLSGSFSKLNDKKKFNGTYSIQDDTTKDSCSYSLILEAEE